MNSPQSKANYFLSLLLLRLAIDLGIPLVSVGQLLGNVQSQYGKDPEYDHPFYKQVYEML